MTITEPSATESVSDERLAERDHALHRAVVRAWLADEIALDIPEEAALVLLPDDDPEMLRTTAPSAAPRWRSTPAKGA